MPPTLLLIGIGRGRFVLPLPVFLLWPLLVFVTLLMPVVLFFVALFGGGWGRVGRWLRAWLLFLLFYCRLRRLHVHTVDEENDFLLSVY